MDICSCLCLFCTVSLAGRYYISFLFLIFPLNQAQLTSPSSGTFPDCHSPHQSLVYEFVLGLSVMVYFFVPQVIFSANQVTKFSGSEGRS